MKLYRKLLLLVAVLVLLGGAYFVSKQLKKPAATENNGDAEKIIKIFSFDSSKVKEISLQKPEGTFEFMKIKDGWKAVQPADLNRLDSLKVDSIVTAMSSLNAEKLINKDTDDVAQYGLDKPVMVTARLEDNTSKALEVGSLTPTGESFYVREKGTSIVYSISKYDGNPFVSNKNDFKLVNLYDIKKDQIEKIAMEKNGKLLFSAKKHGETDFELTAPIKVEADMEAIMMMLQSVESSNIVSFIEDNAKDLAKYGLDKPSYTIEVDTKTEKKKLLIGDEKVKDSEMYARFTDSNDVFTVGVGTYTFLDKPLTEISERFVYMSDIKNVEQLKVEFDGKTVDSKIVTDDKDNSKDRFWVNGKEVTKLTNDTGSQLFRQLYQSVIGVLLTDIKPDEKPNPNAKAEVRFTYKMKKDPKNMVIEFVSRDKYSYYAVRNGEYTGLVVDKSRFDEYDGLRVAYKNLADAMNKQK